MSAGPSRLMKVLSGDGWEVVGAILEATPSIAVIADAEGYILRVSRFGCELSGWVPHQIEGLTISQYVSLLDPWDRDGRPLEEREAPLVRALNGEHIVGFEGSFSNRTGERIPVVVNAAPFVTHDRQVIGAINSATDLRRFKALERELRGAIDEKVVLYEELAHRVKNHLQIMSSLIGLEARHARIAMERMAERLGARMKGLAAIYDRMNQAEFGGQVAARVFIEELVRPYRTESIDVEVTTPEQLTLSHAQAAPFGMLLNEAVCNSYKHAFPGGRGRIDVALRPKAPDQLELEIADNGVGFGPSAANTPSHGLKLMQLQAQQLGAEMIVSNRTGGGARLVLVMPHDGGLQNHRKPDGDDR
jgi:PAS domain S-box-containing protein